MACRESNSSHISRFMFSVQVVVLPRPYSNTLNPPPPPPSHPPRPLFVTPRPPSSTCQIEFLYLPLSSRSSPLLFPQLPSRPPLCSFTINFAGSGGHYFRSVATLSVHVEIILSSLPLPPYCEYGHNDHPFLIPSPRTPTSPCSRGGGVNLIQDLLFRTAIRLNISLLH